MPDCRAGGPLRRLTALRPAAIEYNEIMRATEDTSSNLRHNFIVSLCDGGFFGLALGIASYVTVIPLFVSTLTTSAVLIGLVPATRNVGWQLPQLLMSGRVARLRRFKPVVVLMTLNERVPFLFLGVIALLRPALSVPLTLTLTFAVLTWAGIGGGFTATAWQSMIAKIIPARMRGTFFGAQAAAANLLASGGALVAGFALARLAPPLDFAACFFAATAAFAVSWGFLMSTREPAAPPHVEAGISLRELWHSAGAILRADAAFRWFVAVRVLSAVALLGSAYYAVYSVQRFHLSLDTAGALTAVLMITQVVANPLMGWLSDRWSPRAVLEAGALAAGASALLAWWAPDGSWFYAVFALTGVAYVAFWTITLAMTLEFGNPEQRATYIGLSHTLTAPATLLVPVLGGWLINLTNYETAFAVSVVGALTTAAVIQLRIPHRR
jgi:MFS family permease